MQDKSFCLLRALRYYLDRTKDLRRDKDRFCVWPEEFPEGYCPFHYLSLDATMLLCYQLSDEETRTCIKLEFMMSGPLQLPKDSNEGFFLDQILSASRWKAYNTFTQFYLKDFAWVYSELYHLVPVVAAQQIH